MPSYADNLEWRTNGQCVYRAAKKRKCEGQPGLSGGCLGRYSDDYGGYNVCSQCQGTGIVRFWKLIRVPEFDAPKPPSTWEPDWVEN